MEKKRFGHGRTSQTSSDAYEVCFVSRHAIPRMQAVLDHFFYVGFCISKTAGANDPLQKAVVVSEMDFSSVFSSLQGTYYMLSCVTLRGWIKEAARTLRKPENRALNWCEECFNWVI